MPSMAGLAVHLWIQQTQAKPEFGDDFDKRNECQGGIWTIITDPINQALSG